MALSRRALPFALSCLLVASAFSAGCDKKKKEEKIVERARPALEDGPATFVGRKACAECHEEVMQSFAWSLHDRALSEPKGEVLAAPFAGEHVKAKHIEAAFSKKNGSPIIASGKEYPVKYTIGVDPLQQYVIEVGSKLQVFAAAFDSRDRSQNGKKWLVLSGHDVPAGDPAHFLARDQNYETACAPCHSTNVQISYDYEKDTTQLSLSELDVSCEACHGPGSRHVEMAKRYQDKWPATAEHLGFDFALATYDLRRWVIPPDGKVAALLGHGDAPPERTDEVETCATCHSTRLDLGPRSKIPEEFAFEDRYLVSLLTQDLYFPDGQVKGLAYTHGSFLQSAHAASQVVCSDCHNPHSTELRKPVVELCVTCHQPEAYENEAHHMHRPETTPMPTCVDCHMPERTFIDVDARRDHSFVLPRPEFSERFGVPNACDSCHGNKTPIWATRRIERAHGTERPAAFAPAFAAADSKDAEAPELLAAVFENETFAPIVRASALVRWAARGRKMASLDTAVRNAAKDDDPLSRRAAAEASAFLTPDVHQKVIAPLFEDPVGSVRYAAVVAHLAQPEPASEAKSFAKALDETYEIAKRNAFRPEQLALVGRVLLRKGKVEQALAVWSLCAERFPDYEPPFVARFTTLRDAKKSADAQEALLSGLEKHPRSALLNYERGRELLREEKVRQALPFLQKGFEEAAGPLRRQYGYAYAVAVQSTGDWAEALAVLRIVKKEYPEASEVLEAIELFEKKRAGN